MSSEQPQTTATAPVNPSPPDRRRQRLASYSVQNMVWSTLAVAVVVLAWWALTPNPSETSRRPPDVAQTASYVAEQSSWPVWVPASGEGWTPTVVRYEPLEQVQTWHVSYVSPQGEYVALHQAADVTDDWRAAVLGDARQTGPVELAGPDGIQAWQGWAGEEGSNSERAYVLEPAATGGSTLVLHGTAEQAEFEAFLGAVEARD